MGLPAVKEVNTELKDVSSISVEKLLREQAKAPLCLSAREKVEDGKVLFDVNRNGILVRKTSLDRASQWYVPAIFSKPDSCNCRTLPEMPVTLVLPRGKTTCAGTTADRGWPMTCYRPYLIVARAFQRLGATRCPTRACNSSQARPHQNMLRRAYLVYLRRQQRGTRTLWSSPVGLPSGSPLPRPLSHMFSRRAGYTRMELLYTA